MILGAIEAGGTKFVCGIFETSEGKPGEKPALLSRISIPTTDPDTTIKACLDWFTATGKPPAALGIGCFGPVDLDPASPSWGFVTSTPKPGWRNAPLATVFRERLGIPVSFDTDVNAAILGESRWGAAQGAEDAVYITVGTGIGGGILSGGKLVHGRLHPEIGHMRVGKIAGDSYPGNCPFHGDCLEGLAAGPALGARKGVRAETIPSGDPIWELESRYLARAFSNLTLILAPRMIVLGGGVGMREGLAEQVEILCREELAGYVAGLEPVSIPTGYIRRPGLGHEAGLFGAAALALEHTRQSMHP